jgi:hypothetical protein
MAVMRYDWIIWLVLLVGAIAFLATSALASDRPFLSKGDACWKVRGLSQWPRSRATLERAAG